MILPAWLLGKAGTYLLVGAALAATSFAAGYGLKSRLAAAELAEVRQEFAEFRETAAWAAQEQERKHRDDEQRWRNRISTAEADRRAESVLLRRRLDSAATAAAGVRDEAAILARGRDAATDTAASCRRDAAALAAVLGDVETAGRAMAQAADGHAADVRLLLDSWPKPP